MMMPTHSCQISFGKVGLLVVLLFSFFLPTPAVAQLAETGAPVDTIYNPAIDYGALPRKYEIADITVSGATDNYEDFVIIGYSGLSVGDVIEIPGEEAGILPHYKNWSKLSPTRMTLGQGIAVTPIQLCNAFATIANGGKQMRPTILKEIRSHEGALLRANTPKELCRPLSREISAKVLDMLRGVTDRSKGGTGWRAALHDYTVAGKTGTGQIPINGRYNDTDYNATFVGIFPSTAPRLAILVTLERPRGPRHSGGNVAAPLFAEIAEPIGHYLNIPADKP